MIYLASPYTHEDPAVREARYQEILSKVAELALRGHVCFSPIAYGHAMNLVAELPHTWEFWEKWDREFLWACDEVWVVTMPGWQESAGVIAEIKIGRDFKKPIRYLDPASTLPKDQP